MNRVYYNSRRRCFSLLGRQDNKGPWRVVGAATAVALGAARFVVSDAGRQRMLRSGVRNVHAWVEGKLLAYSSNPLREGHLRKPWGGRRVAYIPQDRPFFSVVDAMGWPVVETAPKVLLRMVAGGPQTWIQPRGARLNWP